MYHNIRQHNLYQLITGETSLVDVSHSSIEALCAKHREAAPCGAELIGYARAPASHMLLAFSTHLYLRMLVQLVCLKLDQFNQMH